MMATCVGPKLSSSFLRGRRGGRSTGGPSSSDSGGDAGFLALDRRPQDFKPFQIVTKPRPANAARRSSTAGNMVADESASLSLSMAVRRAPWMFMRIRVRMFGQQRINESHNAVTNLWCKRCCGVLFKLQKQKRHVQASDATRRLLLFCLLKMRSQSTLLSH